MGNAHSATPCLVHGQGAASKGSLNITAEQPELRSDGKGNMVIEFNINPRGASA